jgi:hypothetical protein
MPRFRTGLRYRRDACIKTGVYAETLPHRPLRFRLPGDLDADHTVMAGLFLQRLLLILRLDMTLRLASQVEGRTRWGSDSDCQSADIIPRRIDEPNRLAGKLISLSFEQRKHSFAAA